MQHRSDEKCITPAPRQAGRPVEKQRTRRMQEWLDRHPPNGYYPNSMIPRSLPYHTELMRDISCQRSTSIHPSIPRLSCLPQGRMWRSALAFFETAGWPPVTAASLDGISVCESRCAGLPLPVHLDGASPREGDTYMRVYMVTRLYVSNRGQTDGSESWPMTHVSKWQQIIYIRTSYEMTN